MREVSRVAALMGVDEKELEARMNYLGLDRDTLRLLGELHQRFETQRPKFIETFYDKLRGFEQTRALLPDNGNIDKLKRAQTRYFEELTAGRYDREYMLNRLQVGVVHQNIGLEPKWYFGAFCHYLSEVIKQIVHDNRDDPGACHARICALLKVVFLDMSLALDAYFYVGKEDQVRLRERATESETRSQILSEAIRQTADSVVITHPDGEITYVNPAFEQVTGYEADEALGRKPNILKSGKHDDEFYQRLWKTIRSGEPFREVFINRRKNGELYYEEKTITPILDREGGSIIHFVSTGKDITERMQAEERLHYLAYHDVLTELPNRLLLSELLKQSLTRARWHRRHFALLFLDLDHFKNINDSLGHEFGDRVLRQVAGRLLEATREGDTVARSGGDEFGILLEDLASSDDIVVVVKSILEAIARPFYLENRAYVITGSIGISCYPEDGMDADALLKQADVAMFRAKDLGKGTYQFYSSEMGERVFERLNLESGLRLALEHEQFVLHYQPQVDCRTGRIVALEALLRWQHPELGLVAPREFIPLLEETGMIKPVGEWVLSRATADFASWRARGLALERITVNLSSRQFEDENLLGIFQQVIEEHHIEPGQLEIEITESLLMETSEPTIRRFDEIRRKGIRIAIDDFGTGYSSLSYLKRFPIDVLKIDRAFVKDAVHQRDSALITGAIISLAHELEMEVVAEGVETEEQLAFLRERFCRYIQGYLFSKPVPAGAVESLIGAFQ